MPHMGSWGGRVRGQDQASHHFFLPLPTCIHLHAQGEAGGLVGKATGFGDGHLCLYPAHGLASSVLELALTPGASLLPSVKTWGCVGREDSPALWACHGPLYFVGTDPMSSGAKPMDEGGVWPGWSPWPQDGWGCWNGGEPGWGQAPRGWIWELGRV